MDKTKVKYHGWIHREKSPGMKDMFSVSYTDENGNKLTKQIGMGEQGAVGSVEFFEVTRGLVHVKMDATPIGLRVYTVET